MDVEFIARLSTCDSYVIDEIVRRGALELDELKRLERMLRLRPHTERLQRSVDAAIARLERGKKGS